MSTERMMCSEAVLSVLNQGLGGGLPPKLPPLADQPFLRKKDFRITVSLKKNLPAFLALIAHK
jgi:hypothetical protein